MGEIYHSFFQSSTDDGEFLDSGWVLPEFPGGDFCITWTRHLDELGESLSGTQRNIEVKFWRFSQEVDLEYEGDDFDPDNFFQYMLVAYGLTSELMYEWANRNAR